MLALPVGSVGIATTTCVPRLMFAVVGAFVVVHASASEAPGVREFEEDVRVQVGTVEIGTAVAVTVTDLSYLLQVGKRLVCTYGKKTVVPAVVGVKV